MKLFFSERKVSESGDNVFALLVEGIDSKYVSDKSQILRDIDMRKNLVQNATANEKFISYGEISVHTVRTNGIKDFCLSCVQFGDGHVEMLVLWNDISEHILDTLSKMAKFLESAASQNLSCEHIVSQLKKL